MKVLNLYAGIGGNRKLWKDVEVTAVENDKEIAQTYQRSFMNDTVWIQDAHKYLLDHYKEFDFIWSSPPCQTHSGTNNFLNAQGIIRYPDMKLWQEVIFLNHFCKVPWVVENVKSYYEPLLKPQTVGRHYLWSNFIIGDIPVKHDIGTMNRGASKICQNKATKSQTQRNCVNPKLGLHVFNSAFKVKQSVLKEN